MKSQAKANSEEFNTYPPSVEAKASFISKMLFLWTNKVIQNARKPNLQESDLIDINECDKLGFILDLIKQQKVKHPNKSIMYHIIQTGIGEYILAFVISLIITALNFAGPIFLNKIIKSIADPHSNNETAFIYVSILFTCLILKAFISQHYAHITTKFTFKLTNQIMGLMYEKLLRISNPAKKYMDPGKMTNLVIMNTYQVLGFFLQAFVIISEPLVVICATGYIMKELGAIGLIAPGLLILSSLLVRYVQNKQVSIRQSVNVIIDQRCKQINEFFQGIKIIKYYAWEDWVLKNLLKIRSKEVKLIFEYLLNIGQVECISDISPSLIAVLCFVVYTLNGNSLTASTAFTVLSLINMLQSPIVQLLSCWGTYTQSKIAYARIMHFLSAEEKSIDYYDKELTKELQHGEIQIINGNFSWESIENENHHLRNPDTAAVNQVKRDKLLKEIKEKKLKEEDISELTAQLKAISEKQIQQQQGISTLQEVNLRIVPGTLNGIYGVFSSGKTTLVHALINELHKNSGRIAVNGSIAYIPQIPWLRSCSLRDNITFGESFELKRYQKILKICELNDDIAQLPGGDMTEIGERGVNLSGGQKQRVSIARAVYVNRDIIIVDDCLSALDSHVGKQIFDNVFLKYLKGKTIVFVTHHQHLMDKFNTVTILQSGKIADHGNYKELVAKGSTALAFLKDHDLNDNVVGEFAKVPEEKESEEQEELPVDKDIVDKQAEELSNDIKEDQEDEDTSFINKDDQSKLDVEKKSKGVLIENEEKAVGSIPIRVYHKYFQIGGYKYIVSAIIVFSVAQTTLMLADWWLSQWSSVAYPSLTSTEYAGVYAILSLSGGVLYLLRYLSFLMFSKKVSKNIFKSLLVRLLKGPMSFFDTTPLGRIVSRFSKDLDSIDYYLQTLLQQAVGGLMNVIGSFVMITMITPLFLAICCVLVFIYQLILQYVLRSTREIKKILDIIRSPLFGVYTEINQGLIQIRSLNKEAYFFLTFEKCVNAVTRSTFNSFFCNRWRSLITEIFSAIIIASAAYLGLAQKEKQSNDYHFAALIGLSISWAFKISHSLPTTIAWIAETEIQMNSVHRILNYIEETPQERPFVLPSEQHQKQQGNTKQTTNDKNAPEQWPVNASLTITNVSYQYRKDTPIILKNVSLSISAKEKIGVIGRTGSGKSTLTLGLLRILELVDEEHGSIVLDGKKISNLGLKELRSNISIIPQDPVLFQGTIRTNIDPFENYTDEQVIDALSKVQLLVSLDQKAKELQTKQDQQIADKQNSQENLLSSEDTNSSLPYETSSRKDISIYKGILELKVDTNGGNFSQGEKQLIALSRVIVRNCKLLLMDEATASIDEKTDGIIQNMIKSHFNDTTIITIAHRIKTIIQYDKILVLSDGEVKEFDSPKKMLANEESYLLKLVREQGKQSEEEMKRLVSQAS